MLEDYIIVGQLFEKYADEASREHILADANGVISAVATCITNSLLVEGPTLDTLNYVKVCLAMLYCEGRNSNIELDKSIWHD